jgi:transmembrane sensor
MTAPNLTPAFQDEPAAWEAVARWLDGGSPPDEAPAVRAWLAADPARAALADVLRGEGVGIAPDQPAVDVEAALRSVRMRMDEPDAASDPQVIPLRRPRTTAPPRRSWTGVGMRIAAVLVVALGAGLLYRQMHGGRSAPAQAYATGVGERRSIDLPDGTKVLLGPGSRLAVAAGYGEKTRDVMLDGDALFEVPHDAAHPFTVRAGSAVIRDLGTRFTVRTAGDSAVNVAVTAGSVELRGSAGADAVVLARGDRGTVGPDTPSPAKAGSVTDDDLAWTSGRLVFRDARLAEVSAELRRWYGVELRTADAALARRPLTASFAGESPRQVVRVVALALGAEVTMHGDTAILRPAGEAALRP